MLWVWIRPDRAAVMLFHMFYCIMIINHELSPGSSCDKLDSIYIPYIPTSKYLFLWERFISLRSLFCWWLYPQSFDMCSIILMIQNVRILKLAYFFHTSSRTFINDTSVKKGLCFSWYQEDVGGLPPQYRLLLPDPAAASAYLYDRHSIMCVSGNITYYCQYLHNHIYNLTLEPQLLLCFCLCMFILKVFVHFMWKWNTL